MLNISTLRSIDDLFPAASGISECLGDRFLYANNQLFRHVRNLFLNEGFQFISDIDERARSYFAAPLVCLQDLLDNGWVPYRNNTAVLSRLVKRSPQFRIGPTSLLSQLAHNHVLHESAHLIANRILSDADKERPLTKTDVVLRVLLGESFANAIESLLIAFVGRSQIHRFFLCLNCYMNYTPDLARREKFLQDLIFLFGFRETFEVSLVAYLYTNTHDAGPPEAVAASWLEAIFGQRELSMAETMLLDLVMRNTFVLNQGFRGDTSRTYFSTLQCEEDYGRFSEMPLDSAQLSQLGVWEQVRSLSGVIANGIKLTASGVRPRAAAD